MLPSHRELFDVPRGVAYLNNAAYTPLPRAVRDAGAAGVGAKSAPWTMDAAADLARAEAVRAAAGRLIGAPGQDIAIVNAAAYGIATAAANLDVPPASRVLVIEGEFPSLAIAWARLAEERGAVLDIVPRPGDGDWTAALLARVEAAGAPPLAVAALTPLCWTDGTAIDLDAVAPAVRRAGAALVIDATQGAGVLDIDVRRLRPDFLVFPTYKWLLGPYTLAFLYVAPHRQHGRPLEQHGAGRVGSGGPFAGRLAPMIEGAARFDMGERLNPVTLPMALAGMRLLESWGRPALEARLRATTDALGAAAEAAGLQVVPRALRAPHVLGVRVPDAAATVARLAAANVYVAERGGTMRIGAHVFNDEADVDLFAAALKTRA